MKSASPNVACCLLTQRGSSWPLKPDFVMEGGNNAIDPATGRADNVDDLMLLTTRVSPDGALLTTKGSIHSDTWTGTAADLADSGVLAVCPIGGWWRTRKHLECWNRKARYALIVSLTTPETDVYTPIANQIVVKPMIET